MRSSTKQVKGDAVTTVICFQSDKEAAWVEKSSAPSETKPVVGPCLQVGEILNLTTLFLKLHLPAVF